MNALSLWLFVFGGLFLNTSWILGGAADGGWFSYVPNAGVDYSPGHGIDFFAIGLLITGIASTVSAVNLTVTVLNMRAPGMTLMKMPVFTWMVFVVQLLLVFALPVITVALILLVCDRLFGANFFDVTAGADPLLWQHLFWIFGHPEVYIIVLPAFGIVSEIIPVFSRKPIFGYPFMVFSGIAIGFMGWGVWAHHMFVSGIGPVSVAAFSLATMFIAVPTGVKILNWLGTMWGGRIEFTTAMKYAISLVAMFTIGGLSGVSHSIAPADTQQTDTYYIVGHFHYTIFGGGVLGFFGGLYFWWPKVFGYKLSEKIGGWNFWLVLIGFNLTFAPMHVLGLQGMSRRIYTYDEGLGFDMWNMVATIGAYVLAVGMLLFLWNIYWSTKRRHQQPPVGPDPWDGRSLEWMLPSPVPEHNFDEVPTIERLDDFWYRKYSVDADGRVSRLAAAEEVAQKGDAQNVHLPSPSYWPIALSATMPIIGYGLIYNLGLLALGILALLVCIFGWVLEPSTEPGGHGHDDHGDHDGDSPADAAAAPANEEAPVG